MAVQHRPFLIFGCYTPMPFRPSATVGTTLLLCLSQSGDSRSSALILTDGDPQTFAGPNRNVSAERDGSNTLKPVFDKDKLEAGFAIVEALQRETGTFLNSRAKETTQAKADLDKELAKPEGERDCLKLATHTQQIQCNTTWEMRGSGRLVLTALTAVAAIAANQETENNALALPFLLPGYDKTERRLGLEACRAGQGA